MSAMINLTDDQIFTALGNFLTAVMPSVCKIIRGQENRVSEPADTDFVVMTAYLRERLKTNQDGRSDVAYVGAIAGTALTISQVLAGAVAVGQVLTGQGITLGTVIESGSGLAWVVSPSQNAPSTVIQSGTSGILQGTKVTVQLDVHGPNSADNSQIISTLFRDNYAVEQFKTSGFDVTPLYADDPKQMPFIDGEQQYEDRWVINAVMQANPIVTIPQQFADALNVELIEVDAAYPP